MEHSLTTATGTAWERAVARGVGGVEEGDKALMPNDTPVSPKAADATLGGNAPIVRISPLFEALLHSANGLLKGKNPSAAVLVAQTAIEVCTERLLLLGYSTNAEHHSWPNGSMIHW